MALSATTQTSPTPSAKRTRDSLASAIGIAIILSIFWTVIGSNVVPAARGHDFLNFYVGGTLAASGRFAEIYDQDVQLQFEQRLIPTTEELVPFVRPHFYALLLSPLALFSLDTALWLWIGLHAAVLVGCWIWAARRFGPNALIFGELYLPTPLGIAHGQDGVFMLAVVIAAYVLASKGRDQAAGAVAALALMKFHITFLFPVGMIIQKRWWMLGAYCATAAGLVAVSAITGGWTGMLSYVHLLQAKDLRRLSPSPDLMVNIHSVTANFGIDQPVISAGLIGLVVMIMFVAVRRAPLWRFWSAVLIGSVLVAPHVFGYDAAMLLLAAGYALAGCSEPRSAGMAGSSRMGESRRLSRANGSSVVPNKSDGEQNSGTFLAPDRYLLMRAPSDRMTTLDRTFRLDGDEIHTVVLRQSSKQRWNAFLWGGGLRLANTFARREAAEKWLKKLLLHHFPGVHRELADC